MLILFHSLHINMVYGSYHLLSALAMFENQHSLDFFSVHRDCKNIKKCNSLLILLTSACIVFSLFSGAKYFR